MSEESPIIGKDILGRTVKDFSNVKWWGIERKEIPWYPRIDYDRCIGCGICLMTCGGRTVYEWDFERMRPVVARPYNCLVGCDTCAKMCPRDAIIFPHIGVLRKYRDEALAIAKARKRLEDIRKEMEAEGRVGPSGEYVCPENGG
ncbi:ferredoxin family protein [Thermococcus sp.]|uniref:4Fe-4S dicluster domain-containing protein n=1 Tax=Thermococcus sp. TaxID=35749 RepID=UPI0025DAFE9D|nr:ferredoxin family protein [Thermococcus sp.]